MINLYRGREYIALGDKPMTHNKKLYLFAITFVIVGLMIAVSASALIQIPEKTSTSKPVIVNTIKNGIAGRSIAKAQTLGAVMHRSSASPLYADPIPVTSGSHPTIAHALTSVCILGFESQEDPNVWFAVSSDQGMTWSDQAIGWQVPAVPALPDADTCNNGQFIGTMVPNFDDNDGSALYKIITVNPLDLSDTGWNCMYWVWKDVGDFTNFKSVATGGYNSPTAAENTWAYGGAAMIGDFNASTNNPELNTNFFSYQFRDDGYAWIYNWNNVTGCSVTGMDIDQDTLYAYAVWNYVNPGNNNSTDLLVYINNFGKWDTYAGYPIHPDFAQYSLNTTGNDTDFDITSYKNNTMIVSQRDNVSIVCYYSFNALKTVNEVTIAANGSNPRIVQTGYKRAACTYINNGKLYYTITTDGGATWSTPTLVEGSDNIPAEHKSTDICGYGATWMANSTISFGPIVGLLPPAPRLTIDITKGFGVGVKATVNNTGDAAATNMEWQIMVNGGILGLIKSNFSGTIATIPAGGNEPIKTGMIIGLGTITVTMAVTCDEGVTAGPLVRDGSQFTIFTIVK